MEIDHEIFSTVILLLPLFFSYKQYGILYPLKPKKLSLLDFMIAKLVKIVILKTFHQNKNWLLTFFHVYICLGYSHIIFMENWRKNITILELIHSLVQGYVQNLFVLIVTGQGNWLWWDGEMAWNTRTSYYGELFRVINTIVLYLYIILNYLYNKWYLFYNKFKTRKGFKITSWSNKATQHKKSCNANCVYRYIAYFWLENHVVPSVHIQVHSLFLTTKSCSADCAYRYIAYFWLQNHVVPIVRTGS